MYGLSHKTQSTPYKFDYSILPSDKGLLDHSFCHRRQEHIYNHRNLGYLSKFHWHMDPLSIRWCWFHNDLLPNLPYKGNCTYWYRLHTYHRSCMEMTDNHWCWHRNVCLRIQAGIYIYSSKRYQIFCSLQWNSTS